MSQKPELDLSSNLANTKIIYHNLPGSELSQHSHNDVEIILSLRGGMRFSWEASGDELAVRERQLIVVPPGFGHSFRSDKAQGERLIILVTPEFWSECGCPPLSEPLVAESSQLLQELLFYVLSSSRVTAEGPLLSSLFIIIRDLLLDKTMPEDSADSLDRLLMKASDERLLKALGYISEHFHNDNFAFETMAKDSGLSTRTMNRLFQKEFSRSPLQVLQSKRIEEAKTLLLRSHDTITEIGFRVGFGSVSTFVNHFRRVTGTNPSSYRQFGEN